VRPAMRQHHERLAAQCAASLIGGVRTGSDRRFAEAAARQCERIATGARSEPRPYHGARSWLGAPRQCRANRHLEPEFKRVACQDH
jgi:hypothetical protein